MSYLALFLTLLGLFLNGRKLMACWPVWIGSNVAWLLHFVPQQGERAAILMNLALLGMNVYGWWNWKKLENPTPLTDSNAR